MVPTEIRKRIEAYKPMSLSEAEREVNVLGTDSYTLMPRVVDLSFCMDRADWLTLFGSTWTGFENVGRWIADGLLDNCAHVSDLDGPCIEMMDDEERKKLADLPDEITVYRGCYAVNKWGVSWTLDRGVAERYPFLHGYFISDARPLLVKARIKKSKVTALKTDGDEFEVICLCERPKHISTSTAKDRAGN